MMDYQRPPFARRVAGSFSQARKLRFVLASILPVILVAAPATPVSAAESVSNPPSTYVNANFGPPPAGPPFNFWRSKTTLDFDSSTADVNAERHDSEVRISVSAFHDPFENSAAYSAYDIGT